MVDGCIGSWATWDMKMLKAVGLTVGTVGSSTKEGDPNIDLKTW